MCIFNDFKAQAINAVSLNYWLDYGKTPLISIIEL